MIPNPVVCQRLSNEKSQEEPVYQDDEQDDAHVGCVSRVHGSLGLGLSLERRYKWEGDQVETGQQECNNDGLGEELTAAWSWEPARTISEEDELKHGPEDECNPLVMVWNPKF